MNPQVVNDHVMLTTTLNSEPSFFPLKGQICTCYDFICNFYLNSTTYHIDIFTSSAEFRLNGLPLHPGSWGLPV